MSHIYDRPSPRDRLQSELPRLYIHYQEAFLVLMALNFGQRQVDLK